LAYLGAKPLTAEYYFDVYDGDGITDSFVTTIAPATPVSVIVTIDGVIADPETYYFEGSNIYFFTPPSAGTRNIQLRYLSIPTSGVAAPQTYRQVDEFIAYEGQTHFYVRYYDLGYIDVFVNGVQLGNIDYQASDNSTVILQVGARAGDLVRIISAYNTVLSRSTLNVTANAVVIGNGLGTTQEVLPSTGTLLTSNGVNWFASNTVTGNVTINGSLTVTGNTTTVAVNNIALSNGLIYLAADNPTNTIDLGTVGAFTSSYYQHTGVVRDASDGTWKFFSNVIAEPTNTVDFTAAVYDTIQVGGINTPTVTVNGRELGVYTQSAFDKANTGVNNAASASSYANTGINNAASASLYANTGITLAQAAYNQGNSTATYANTGINNAASASTYANTGINNAASASLYANTGINNAASASIYANTAINNAASASAYANAAYAAANTSGNLIPQNAISACTYSYALVNTDAGKHIYFTTTAGSATLYIPNNGQVNWPIGTTIMVVSKTSGSANVVVTPNTGVSMYLAANSTSSSRNVTTYGMATLLNTGANTWFINGSGVV
jgi:hypothetical protein